MKRAVFGCYGWPGGVLSVGVDVLRRFRRYSIRMLTLVYVSLRRLECWVNVASEILSLFACLILSPLFVSCLFTFVNCGRVNLFPLFGSCDWSVSLSLMSISTTLSVFVLWVAIVAADRPGQAP